ncbi:uncharacterized protein BDZ83DRAFT_42460 [Colletotrichum acutatum]|uniref:2EXR domain-containing protein n=1 Tax=Glomerella acutata TaxID=27357 RepID=A0AAD8UCX8_GLOAC|nr:uncharacterized protein BDZ83DRAFT_42460 [Colletotrichum acutatum]KAK1716159.1 hypothetical protein BDZ83DRAFT_42460 [Colletotrichum acutatum]
MAAHFIPSASIGSREVLAQESGREVEEEEGGAEEELFTDEEEDEPEIKDELKIFVDATNREAWSDVVLQARRHMRCHPKHPGRVRDGGRVCILVDSSSSDEEDGNNKLLVRRAEPGPANPTFTLFTQLPKELRDSILLTAVDPIAIEGWIKIDLEWRNGPQAHFFLRRIRSWAAIPLFAVSRETRALAVTAFGVPDPRTFPFSPARDAVELVWDGAMLPTTWRRVEDYRLAGPVIAGRCRCGGRETRHINIDHEWAMPRETRERVQSMFVDGRYARFDLGLRDGTKGPWGLVFGLVNGFFGGVRVLGVRLWDSDDEGFEGSFDTAKGEALYRVDQMDFFDGMEEILSEPGAEDQGVRVEAPFPRLRLLRVLPEIPWPKRPRKFRFRKVRGSHFLVVGRGGIPTAKP